MEKEEMRMSASIENTAKKWSRGLQGLKLITFGGSLILWASVLFLLSFLLKRVDYNIVLQISMIIPVAVGLTVLEGSVFRAYYEKRTGYAEPRTGPLRNKHALLIAAILFIAVIVMKFSFAPCIYRQTLSLSHFLHIPYGVFPMPLVAIVLVFYGIFKKDFFYVAGAAVLVALYIPVLFLGLDTFSGFSYSLFSIGLALLIPGIMYHMTYLELYKKAKHIEGAENVQE